MAAAILYSLAFFATAVVHESPHPVVSELRNLVFVAFVFARALLGFAAALIFRAAHLPSCHSATCHSATCRGGCSIPSTPEASVLRFPAASEPCTPASKPRGSDLRPASGQRNVPTSRVSFRRSHPLLSRSLVPRPSLGEKAEDGGLRLRRAKMACRSIAEAALYRVLLSCQGQERRRLGIGREQKRRLRDAGDREGGRRRRMSGVVVEGEGEAEKGQEKDHDLTGRREKPQGSSMAVEVQRRDIAAEEEVSGYGKMKGNSGWNLEGEHLGEDENKEVVSVELRRGGMEEEEEEEEEEEGDEEEEGSRGGMVTLRKALEGKERGTPRNTSKRDFGERERGEERRNPSPAGFDCYSADGAGNRRGSLVEGSCDWSPCASQQKPLFLPDLRDASPYIHSHGSDAEISYCHSSHEKGSSRFKSHETPPHAWQLHPHTQNHLHSPFCPLSLAPHQPSYRSSLRTCRRASSRASRRTSLDNELFVQGEEEEEEGEEEEEQEEGKEGEERQEDDLLVLRRALEHETELSDSLRRELEQERAAADSAAQASMDLIHQLQQDKASAQRAAGSAAQRERILEQKVLSDKEEMEELRAVLESQEEEVGLLRRLLEQKQEEVRALEAELALWRGHVAGADWLAEVEEDGAEEGSVEEGSVEEGSVEEGSVEEGSVGEGSCLVGVEDLDAPLLGEESGSGGRDEAGLGVEGIEEGGDEKEVRQGEE